MKKQIIFEYSKVDDLDTITVSTPHHDKFDIYIEQGNTLKEACENVIKLIGNSPRFFLEFFQETGFSSDLDITEHPTFNKNLSNDTHKKIIKNRQTIPSINERQK